MHYAIFKGSALLFILSTELERWVEKKSLKEIKLGIKEWQANNQLNYNNL